MQSRVALKEAALNTPQGGISQREVDRLLQLRALERVGEWCLPEDARLRVDLVGDGNEVGVWGQGWDWDSGLGLGLGLGPES